MQALSYGLRSGFVSDRQLIVTDANGRFVTARRYPKMVLIGADTAPDGKSITLSGPGQKDLKVQLTTGTKVTVEIWKQPCAGYDLGSAAGEWLSKFILEDPKGGLRLMWHGDKEKSSTRPMQVNRINTR